jgi:O-Antigen ligase
MMEDQLHYAPSHFNLAKRGLAKRASNRPPTSFILGAFLSMFFIVEGLFVKSFVFVGNDPVVVHYLVSAATCTAAGLILFFTVGLKNLSVAEFVLLLGSFGWSFASSFLSGQQGNLLASGTFALSTLMSFVFVPRLMMMGQYDALKFLRNSLGIITFLSAILLVVAPNLANDTISGRFSGAAISVAVACSVFFFATVFYGYDVREKTKWRERAFSLFILCLAFGFLFLTYTRSLLVEASVMLMIVILTSRAGKIQGKTLIVAVGVFLILAFLGLLYLVMKDLNIEQLMVDFRLADGGSATDSRMGNWLFALQRIGDAPWFGEGMLTKQTAGGGELDLNAAGTTYSVLYDPHSLPLSLGVQAGIPFALIMLGFLLWIHIRYVITFGLARSLASVDFMIGIFVFIGMFPGGGDLTSMGNAIDRIYWILLGIFSLRTNLEVAKQKLHKNQVRISNAQSAQVRQDMHVQHLEMR